MCDRSPTSFRTGRGWFLTSVGAAITRLLSSDVGILVHIDDRELVPALQVGSQLAGVGDGARERSEAPLTNSVSS